MKHVVSFVRMSIIILFLLPFDTFSQLTDTLVNGVSERLAIYRKQVLSNINYSLSFIIPPKKRDPISAKETISFNWKQNTHPLQIDFKESRDHVQKITINARNVDIVLEKEHLLIDPGFLTGGNNEVAIDFIAGNLSLNRNDDYLYTLLVPDRARTVFPCFDQPDLKALFKLSLTIPKEWKALSNAPLYDSSVSGMSKTFRFEPSDKISTYLFSFATGKFEVIQKIIGGRPMNFYHRETDTAKIRLSTDPIFQIQHDALTFLEEYTQVPFPFKKFDFVAIPDFQYGGMEHVGSIQYKASSLFLDGGATRDEEINRSSLLSHETAHMWFGDLVTMRWFNDVWEKEVFANFMADKITQVALANTNFDLKFLLDHFPAAYAIDRTAAPNPIRQPLENLQDAGSLYGNIIYHKAPIMMRQLERLMGKDDFRDGLREYLKTYAHTNASWPDLIKILSKYTKSDLEAWNNVWVNETGRPIFEYQIKYDKNTIGQFVISQRAEDGSKKMWPQIFEIALVYLDHHIEEVTVNMINRTEVIKQAIGKKVPAYILFNSSGQGYGVFPIDSNLVNHVDELTNPVMRASTYINLFENMIAGNVVKPLDLLDQYRSKLSTENEELNLRLITGQMSEIFWHFILPAKRKEIVGGLENDLWTTLQKESSANKKKLLFRTFQNIALSGQSLDTLYTIWKTQKAPSGVTLTEDDYTSLSLALALRDYPDTGILREQLHRIQNPDRQKRLQFLMPALSPEVNVRDSFFASLTYKQNREKESWVTTALQYLHHPLRLETSQKYLKASLELLQEVQLTGDIFFPQSWLQSTFGLYQTPEAVGVVREFLQSHPGYNPKLRAKIIQAADGLFRAKKMLYN